MPSHITHFDIQDEVDDGLLRHRMKSGSVFDDGFVLRTPNLLQGASFRPFGAYMTGGPVGGVGGVGLRPPTHPTGPVRRKTDGKN